MADNEGFFPFSILGSDWHWLPSRGGCWARLASGSGQWIPWFCRLQEMKYWLHWGQETTARILTICVFQEHGNYCSSRHIFFRNGDNGPQISVTLRLGMLIECTTFALIDCSFTFLPLLWAWMRGRERQKGRRKEGQSWLPPLLCHLHCPSRNEEFGMHLILVICMWVHCCLYVLLPVFREHSKWKIILPKLSLLTCILARSVVFSFGVLKSIPNVCALPQND